MSVHLPRWTVASVYKVIGDLLKPTAHVHFENFQRRTDDKTEWFELRVTGPDVERDSRTRRRAEISVNILIVLQPNVDAYKLQRLFGVAEQALVRCFACRKYGDDVQDDGTIFGTYVQKRRADPDKYGVIHGAVDPNTSLQRAQIECEYELYYTE